MVKVIVICVTTQLFGCHENFFHCQPSIHIYSSIYNKLASSSKECFIVYACIAWIYICVQLAKTHTCMSVIFDYSMLIECFTINWMQLAKTDFQLHPSCYLILFVSLASYLDGFWSEWAHYQPLYQPTKHFLLLSPAVTLQMPCNTRCLDHVCTYVDPYIYMCRYFNHVCIWFIISYVN